MSWLFSLDCGKERDPSVLGAIETWQNLIDPNVGQSDLDRRYKRRAPVKIVNRYTCRGLKRYELGMNYTEVALDVATRMKDPRLLGDVDLVVDAGGVGNVVIEMLGAHGLNPIGIATKGGGDTTFRSNDWGGVYLVPKEEMIFALVVAFQTRRFEIVKDIINSPDGRQALRELQNFEMKRRTSGQTLLEAHSEDTHDDIVTMFAQAVWYGQRNHFEQFAEGPLEEPEERSTDGYDPLTWKPKHHG